MDFRDVGVDLRVAGDVRVVSDNRILGRRIIRNLTKSTPRRESHRPCRICSTLGGWHGRAGQEKPRGRSAPAGKSADRAVLPVLRHEHLLVRLSGRGVQTLD